MLHSVGLTKFQEFYSDSPLSFLLLLYVLTSFLCILYVPLLSKLSLSILFSGFECLSFLHLCGTLTSQSVSLNLSSPFVSSLLAILLDIISDALHFKRRNHDNACVFVYLTMPSTSSTTHYFAMSFSNSPHFIKSVSLSHCMRHTVQLEATRSR